MKNNIQQKLKKLRAILKKMNSCLIAYSGGVDSSLLLKVAQGVLGDKLLAVIATSETYPKDELKQAKKIANDLGVKFAVIRTDEFNQPNFRNNPLERCYYCKKELFTKLKKIASKDKINYLIDGSNFDDRDDFRPGELAKKDLKVRSPLREVGLRKDEIRWLSKKLGLSTWDKPSLACLASRFPYGTKIDKEKLKRIDKGERFIRSLGIKQVRLRDHGNLARIEVNKEDLPLLIDGYRLSIAAYLKRIGYNYITVDLEGYRTGSMNLHLKGQVQIGRGPKRTSP